jgi:hypothetical protein
MENKQETHEYSLLQHIKFCLECKNESQAIRLIEQYGFDKQEQDKNMYSEEDMKKAFHVGKLNQGRDGDTSFEKFIEQFKKK